ncbi:DNA replication complex subunit Gins51 [Thermococcus sp.]
MDIVKLREMLEAELSKAELADVDASFYEDLDSFLKALKLSAEASRERGEEVEEHLYTEQLRIAEWLVKEMLRARLHKLVEMVFSGPTAQGELVGPEKELFVLLNAFVEGKGLEMGNLVMEVPLKPSPLKSEGDTVRETKTPVREAYIIEEDIPAVIDEEFNEYGPFRAGDLSVLPEKIAKILVARGLAKRVRISF